MGAKCGLLYLQFRSLAGARLSSLLFNSLNCCDTFAKIISGRNDARRRASLAKKSHERDDADARIRPHAVSYRSTFSHWSASYHSPSNFSEEDNTERMKLLLPSPNARAFAHTKRKRVPAEKRRRLSKLILFFSGR